MLTDHSQIKDENKLQLGIGRPSFIPALTTPVNGDLAGLFNWKELYEGTSKDTPQAGKYRVQF